MPDVYQIVTDRVMAALEMEEVPWQRPWCIVNGDGGSPMAATLVHC